MPQSSSPNLALAFQSYLDTSMITGHHTPALQGLAAALSADHFPTL
jgi:hypothetical protein